MTLPGQAIPRSPLNRCHSVKKEGRLLPPTNEAMLLVRLALPSIVISFGYTVPTFLVASVVGRQFGSLYLDGFALSSLTTNLFSLSILHGLYSASETLGPQAYGAGNAREVGILTMRGYFGTLIATVPMLILLFLFMGPILVFLGQDPVASRYAWHWYRIYAFSLPFYSLYETMHAFLIAQEVMLPMVLTVVTNLILVLPTSLSVLSQWFGFSGTALAMIVYHMFQSLFLLSYLVGRQPHDPVTWPGLAAWREALQRDKLIMYMTLGLGGILVSSEWIAWEVMGLMVGKLGVTPLSVHTIPTQVIIVAFMIPLGIGAALSIRIATLLSQDIRRAKVLTIGCLGVSVVILSLMGLGMYVFQEQIFAVFTEEEQVLEGCRQIWDKVSIYFVICGLWGVNMGIASGLGMQWTLGVTTIIGLFVLGLPATYYYAIVRGGGLNAAWVCAWPPYAFINAVLLIAFAVEDWDAIGAMIRIREMVETGDLETLALQSDITHSYGSSQDSDRIEI